MPVINRQLDHFVSQRFKAPMSDYSLIKFDSYELPFLKLMRFVQGTARYLSILLGMNFAVHFNIISYLLLSVTCKHPVIRNHTSI